MNVNLEPDFNSHQELMAEYRRKAELAEAAREKCLRLFYSMAQGQSALRVLDVAQIGAAEMLAQDALAHWLRVTEHLKEVVARSPGGPS